MNLDDLFVNIGQWWTNLLSDTLALPDGVVTVINGLIGGLILALLGTVMVLVLTYMERKVFARLQDRIGPNRWGPYGVLQAIADAIKMLIKEDIVHRLNSHNLAGGGHQRHLPKIVSHLGKQFIHLVDFIQGVHLP